MNSPVPVPIWLYRDNQGIYQTFQPNISATIEHGFEDKEPIQINIGGISYTIDYLFGKMINDNINTDIRRELLLPNNQIAPSTIPNTQILTQQFPTTQSITSFFNQTFQPITSFINNNPIQSTPTNSVYLPPDTQTTYQNIPVSSSPNYIPTYNTLYYPGSIDPVTQVPIYNIQPLIPQQYYWVDDDDVPKPYDVNSNNEINKAVLAGLSEVTVTINKHTYVINFHTMKQRNILTHLVRDVTLNPQIIDQTLWIPQWQPNMNSNPNLEIITLYSNNIEFQNIAKLFQSTLSNSTILKIEKIINHRLKSLYDLELQHVKQKHNYDPSIGYVKLLFHGTKIAHPSKIYNSEKGFMMQYAGDGMWGRGMYFAQNASYSDRYSYTQNNINQMFLAEVIVGDSCFSTPDNTLILPPKKQVKTSQVGFSDELYDSVYGKTGGSRIYIVYDNNKAYPTYLISYK